MTTTNMYQGMGDISKPTSRVLRPPGGSPSNIFGDPEPTPTKAAAQSSVQPEPQLDQNNAPVEDQSEKPEDKEEKPRKTAEEDGDDEKAENDEQALANKSKNRGAYNPITGEEYGASQQPSLSHNNNAVRKPDKPAVDSPAKTEMPKAAYHSSTRVRQPPGGASSGLW